MNRKYHARLNFASVSKYDMPLYTTNKPLGEKKKNTPVELFSCTRPRSEIEAKTNSQMG